VTPPAARPDKLQKSLHKPSPRNRDNFALGVALIFPLSFLLGTLIAHETFSTARDLWMVALVCIVPIVTIPALWFDARRLDGGLPREVNQKVMEVGAAALLAFALLLFSNPETNPKSDEPSNSTNATVECKAQIKKNAVVEALDCTEVKTESKETTKMAMDLLLIVSNLKIADAGWTYFLSRKSKKDPKTAG